MCFYPRPTKQNSAARPDQYTTSSLTRPDQTKRNEKQTKSKQQCASCLFEPVTYSSQTKCQQVPRYPIHGHHPQLCFVTHSTFSQRTKFHLSWKLVWCGCVAVWPRLATAFTKPWVHGYLGALCMVHGFWGSKVKLKMVAAMLLDSVLVWSPAACCLPVCFVSGCHPEEVPLVPVDPLWWV